MRAGDRQSNFPFDGLAQAIDPDRALTRAYMGEAVLSAKFYFAPLNASADATALAGSLATRSWQKTAPAFSAFTPSMAIVAANGSAAIHLTPASVILRAATAANNSGTPLTQDIPEARTATDTGNPLPQIGLVLPGGGARAAYQVGVLRALADLLPARSPNPFPVIAGTSAGAINATELAIHAERFRIAAVNLERVWRNFEVRQVFRADVVSMLRGSMHWFLAMMSGGWLLPPPKSLFDNHPLRELLLANFDFDGISRAIRARHLQALAIAAAGYSSSRSVSFFEGPPEKHSWYRVRRGGEATKITIDHLMASVAVPFLFPPVLMANEYYGDGSMRQATPFSAAIHLGADRLLVIGTRNDARTERRKAPRSPSFGHIFGYMLDALFSDGLYSDLERLNQINDLLRQVGPVRTAHSVLKPVDLLVILPSKDLSDIARMHADSLPRTLRMLLRMMGAMNPGGSELMSYLMFQGAFTRDLIALGYRDAMDRSGEIMRFFGGEHVQSTGATQTMRRLQADS